jgi:hypothetical protein
MRLLVCVMVGTLVACSSSSSGDPQGQPAPSPTADPPSGPDSPPAPAVVEGSFTRPLACPGEGVANEPMPAKEIFEALRVELGFDFLERRPLEASGVDGSGFALSVGTACSTAAAPAVCASALSAVASTDALFHFKLDTFVKPPPGYYLAYSKGDVVGKISTPAELRALLPTVGRPVAALMVAEAADYRVECTRSWLREEPGGFVLLTTKGPACGRDRITLLVKPDGTLEERTKVKTQSACL